MTIVTVGAGKDYAKLQLAIDYLVGLGALADDYDIVCSGGETFDNATSTYCGNFVGIAPNGHTVTVRGETLAKTGWPILTTVDTVDVLNLTVAGVDVKWCYIDWKGNDGIHFSKGVVKELHVRAAGTGLGGTAVSFNSDAGRALNVFIYLKAGGSKYGLGFSSGVITQYDFCTVRDAVLGMQSTYHEKWRNCIVDNCTTGIRNDGSNGEMNYTCFSNCVTAGKYASVNYATLALLQTASGKEANSIEADAQLTSATDLHILGTSPCIDAGETLAGITTDIDGDTRSSPPDIGADEYVQPVVNNMLLMGVG